MKRKNFPILALATLAFALLASGGARADTNLVVNGSFEDTTNGAGLQFDSSVTGSVYTSAVGWTSANSSPGSAYNFIFASGTADTTGVTGSEGTLSLWGTNNGGLDIIPASSPDGGNFVAADGDYQTAAISQTITGLTAGDSYTLGFWWAASQQSGFNGDTQQYWSVSFGSENQTTATYDLTSHAFSGWMYQTMTFTADSSSDVLSFLAVGNLPVPPFLLLDGVSMYAAVPEPSSMLIFATGVVVLGAVKMRSRRRPSRPP